MHQFTIVALAFAAIAVILCSSPTSATPIPVPVIRCPQSPETINPTLQAICDSFAGLSEQGGDLGDTQLYDRGAKRQDVDHVFLRFGRRLGL